MKESVRESLCGSAHGSSMAPFMDLHVDPDPEPIMDRQIEHYMDPYNVRTGISDSHCTHMVINIWTHTGIHIGWLHVGIHIGSI